MNTFFKILIGLLLIQSHVFCQSKIKNGSILFSVTPCITDSGKTQAANLKTKMLEQLKKEAGDSEDTLVGQAILAIFSNVIDSFDINPSPYSIKITFTPDTIWRYYLKTDTIVGDYFRIDPVNGKSWHFARTNNFSYPNQDFIGYHKSGNIKVDKNDTKKILGFDCYKVIYELEPMDAEEENFKIDEGNTVYEMYVTDAINLPVHALLTTYQLINQFFPLEIKKYSKNLNGISEKYTAKYLSQ